MDLAQETILRISMSLQNIPKKPTMSTGTPLTEYVDLTGNKLFQLNCLCIEITGHIGYRGENYIQSA